MPIYNIKISKVFSHIKISDDRIIVNQTRKQVAYNVVHYNPNIKCGALDHYHINSHLQQAK